MSDTSAASLRKDDNGGKSDSDGDIFDKIRSIFGDAICEALQSKFYLGEHAHLNSKLKGFKNFTVHFKLSLEIFESLVQDIFKLSYAQEKLFVIHLISRA